MTHDEAMIAIIGIYIQRGAAINEARAVLDHARDQGRDRLNRREKRRVGRLIAQSDALMVRAMVLRESL